MNTPSPVAQESVALRSLGIPLVFVFVGGSLVAAAPVLILKGLESMSVPIDPLCKAGKREE